MSKASESIRKIQEAARQRVLERMGKGERPKSTSKISDELVWVKAAELKRAAMSQVHTALADNFDVLKQEIVRQFHESDKGLLQPVDIMPNNCRFVSQKNNAGIMILEFPPTNRIVNAYCSVTSKRRPFNIPFPYLYFILGFQKLQIDGEVAFRLSHRGIGARTSPLKSFDDEIGTIPIPHTEGLHYICQSEKSVVHKSLQDLTTDVVNTFWRTEFVHSFVGFKVNNKKVGSWTDWEKLTALDMLKVNLSNLTKVQKIINLNIGESVSSTNILRGQIQNLVAHAERTLHAKIKGYDFTKDIAKAMKEIVAQDSE